MEQPAISDDIQAERPVTGGYDSLVRTDATDGLCTLSVTVQGVHCAGCIQKIESRLAREQDVVAARLNFSTGRLEIRWNGLPARADDLVRAVESLGYTVQPFDPGDVLEGSLEEERFLLLCLGVAGFAMGNIMLLSVGLWASSGEEMGESTRQFLHWVSAAIALPAILFSGRPFFRSAAKSLMAGGANMDVPISLAILLASGMSLFETLHHGEHTYFDSAVMLMFFLLTGRYLDARARRSARSTATGLLGMLSGFALVVDDDGRTSRLPVRELTEDMRVRVAAGEKFPADGTVEDGETEIDTALVTGETLPRAATPGTEVYAGTVNLSAPVTVRVAKAAEDSLLSDIVRLMEKAGQGQARYVRLADRAARLYTPVVHTLAAGTFAGWWFLGGAAWQDALMTAVTVLIITCPCALGLAVPVVQVLATGRLMQGGILVKAGDALERLAGIDTVILDKTGTLTLGRPALEGSEIPEHLKLAASLAGHSSHPLSQALVSAWEKEGDGHVYAVRDVREHPGRGLEGTIDGQTIRLGNRVWCGIQDTDGRAQDRMELWLAADGEAPVPFYFSDPLRPDAQETVQTLRAQGLRVVLLSGDRAAVVARMAGEAGIAVYAGDKTPVEKYAFLEDMKMQGHKVLMVGDGLNDAPVLAGSDVSASPSTAIDMAQSAADIVFMGDRLGPVALAHAVARSAQRLVKQNFALAVAYNIIAVPLAVAGAVTPMIAAAAMSGSSLLVIANSFRLRRKRNVS